ncbi:MAG: hypothetical protein ABEI31_03115 [Halodesulfurarchaeum sp.]
MRDSSRREMLVVGGTVLGSLAGCFSISHGSDPGPDNPDTATPTPTATKSGETDRTPKRDGEGSRLDFDDPYESDSLQVQLSDPFHRHSLLYQTYPDAVTVGQHPGRQFLFVSVSVEGDQARSLEPGDFSVDVGDSSYPGWRRYGDFEDGYGEFSGAAEGMGQAFGNGNVSGWVGFAIPVPIQEHAPRVVLDVQHDRVTWSLPNEVIAALSHLPPDWRVTDFTVETGDSGGDPRTVSVTIQNRGEGEGSFPIGINYSGSVHAYETVRVSVPPLESRTWSDSLTVGDRAPAFELVTPVQTFQGESVETG